MKKTIILIMLSIVFVTCQTEESNQEPIASKSDISFDFKELTNSNIGIEKGGEIELNVPKEKILATFKKFNSKLELGLEPQSFNIIKEDGKSYLRFYSNKNQVSTIALIKDSNNKYRTGGTVCTSTSCADGGGCVPNGEYCTSCRPNGPNMPKGDCKRSTTGIEDQE